MLALLFGAGGVSTAQTAGANSSQRIRGIEIHTNDVFGKGEDRGLIPKIANGLHFTTRASIVRRELLLRAGDVYDSARVAETERNLRSLRVFRRVRIDSVRTDSGLVLKVNTHDAFTTRVEVSFGRSGGGRRGFTWSAGLQEKNLFGSAAFLGVRYRDTPDRSALLFEGQRPRLFRNSIGLSAMYDDRSDGRIAWASLARPFFSSLSKSSWHLTGEDRQERILQFEEGVQIPVRTLERRYRLAAVGIGLASVASPQGYLRWGLNGQIRREDYADHEQPDTLGRSVFAAIGASVELQRARFLVSQGIEGFGRDEDIDLSSVLHVGLSVTPSAFGYPDDGIVPNVSARTGVGFRRGFARIAASGHGRLTDAGVIDSGAAHIGAMAVLKPRTRHLAVFFAGHGWQNDPAPGAEFDLGLTVGPRGFGQHEFTGDRVFFTTAEYRITLVEELLQSMGIAVAGFADYGGAWFAGQRRRTGYAIGAGVRLGVTIDTGLEPIRVDFARVGGTGIAPSRWELAIGKGFVFNNVTLRLDR